MWAPGIQNQQAGVVSGTLWKEGTPLRAPFPVFLNRSFYSVQRRREAGAGRKPAGPPQLSGPACPGKLGCRAVPGQAGPLEKEVPRWVRLKLRLRCGTAAVVPRRSPGAWQAVGPGLRTHPWDGENRTRQPESSLPGKHTRLASPWTPPSDPGQDEGGQSTHQPPCRPPSSAGWLLQARRCGQSCTRTLRHPSPMGGWASLPEPQTYWTISRTFHGQGRSLV